MRTSARNALRGTVTAVTEGPIAAEVVLGVGEGHEIIAVITRRSVADLDLRPGREAVALIKASFVLLARDEEVGRVSARNRLSGVIKEVTNGPINCEITLDLGGGLDLTAVLTRGSVEALGLEVGERACALIKASHVILAVD